VPVPSQDKLGGCVRKGIVRKNGGDGRGGGTNYFGWGGSPSRLLVHLPVCLHFAPENPDDGEMYFLVPAYLGCRRQSPQSRKMVVCVAIPPHHFLCPENPDWATLGSCDLQNILHVLYPNDNLWSIEEKVILPSVLWRCWLGSRKSIQPVKTWVVRYWHGYLTRERCKWFAYGSADAIATPSSLASLKSRMVYLSGAGLPRLSWKKGC